MAASAIPPSSPINNGAIAELAGDSVSAAATTVMSVGSVPDSTSTVVVDTSVVLVVVVDVVDDAGAVVVVSGASGVSATVVPGVGWVVVGAGAFVVVVLGAGAVVVVLGAEVGQSETGVLEGLFDPSLKVIQT